MNYKKYSKKKYIGGSSRRKSKGKKTKTKKASGSSNNKSIRPSSNSNSSSRSLSSPTNSLSLPTKSLSSPSVIRSDLAPTKSNINNINNINNTVTKVKAQYGNKLVKELHRDVFNFIRTELKNMSGDKAVNAMFLFSEPSALVNDFIYCLYNQNEEWNGGVDKDNLFMMTSILELNDEPNTIYITISEEPDSQDNFLEKINKLITLIRWIVYEYSDILKLRNTLGSKIELIDCPSYIKKQLDIMPKKIYRGIKKLDKPESIKKLEKVKIIYNQTYIKNRRKGISYEPFYKTDKESGKNVIACNSGSICSESKIFSYLHTKNRINNIEGMIAYWIGNRNLTSEKCSGTAECHYHPKYCYNHTNLDDNVKLKYIVDYMKKNKLISKTLLEKGDDQVIEIFRGYALPCPGCTLNFERYMKDIKNTWDISQCIERNKESLGKRKSARQKIMDRVYTHE